MSAKRFETFPFMIFSSMSGGVSFPFGFKAAASNVCCLQSIGGKKEQIKRQMGGVGWGEMNRQGEKKR